MSETIIKGVEKINVVDTGTNDRMQEVTLFLRDEDGCSIKKVFHATTFNAKPSKDSEILAATGGFVIINELLPMKVIFNDDCKNLPAIYVEPEGDEERRYTAKEIEEMLTLPCCHISGTHDPTHYSEGRYVCNNQVAEAFEKLCMALLINPVTKHKETCYWCNHYPDKNHGDGKEYWDQPNRCARCGDREYLHERDNHKCKDFLPTTYEEILRLHGPAKPSSTEKDANKPDIEPKEE